MKASEIINYGEQVIKCAGALKGRRAIEAMGFHKALAEALEKVSTEKNELVKAHGTDGAIGPDNKNWQAFLVEYTEMLETAIDLPAITFTADDAEKYDFTTSQLALLDHLGLWT